ncbi:MAG: SDR family oxidoreductase [Polyangiaceae bacterium]|nr:SDR family oxidoreductase [Polyangiaceae bacterium]
MTKAGALEGRVAVVTGGASGIGAALGRELSRRGADVVLADRQLVLAEAVAREACAAGGRVRAAELDVRDGAAVKVLVDDTVRRTGRLDFFFGNAGISVGGEIDGYSAADWDDVFDVNLRGVTNGIQAAYPVMVRQGHGHLVHTASIAGLVATPAQGSYTASKHAVVGLTKALRIEAARHGVRVSALCPGAVQTSILSGGRFGRLNVPGLHDEDMAAIIGVLRPMAPERFARQAIDGVLANQAIIIVPRWWRAFWYLERLSPTLSLGLWHLSLAELRRQVAKAVGSRRASG